MRRPSRRILTVLPLFVLITLSFFVFLVESTASPSPDIVARHSRQFAAKRSLAARQGGDQPAADDGRDEDGGSSVTTKTTTSSSQTTSEATSTTTSSSSESTSSTSSTSTSSTSSSVTTSSTTSSSVVTSSSTASSTTSSTLSVPTSTTSSSSRTSSRTTTSSSSRTTLQVTTVPISTATSVVPATNIQSRITTSSSAPQTSAAESTETASSNGFLSNKGAVAGTFTALGIVVVGGICAGFLFLRKRKRNEELDIFDTEYHEYSSQNDLGGSSGGNGDHFVSDMSSLSANAVTHAGAHPVEPDYSHLDYGVGMPPAAGSSSNRTSVASNHAGYGAFRSATEQRKPPMQKSGLRSEVTWNNDEAYYVEPAVDENQSIHVVGNDNGPYYASAVRVPGSAY